jgi:putative DNA primase/helicase
MTFINPDIEEPEKRKFSGNPFDDVLADRGKYIGAILTIARAYISAGRPDVDFIPPLSFAAWSNFVQKPLIWLGATDPALSIQNTRKLDPERAIITQVLTPWYDAIGPAPVTVQMLSSRMNGNENLRNALMRVAAARDGQSLDSVRMGKWLGRYVARVVDGLKVTRDGNDTHSKAVIWKVVQTRRDDG